MKADGVEVDAAAALGEIKANADSQQAAVGAEKVLAVSQETAFAERRTTEGLEKSSWVEKQTSMATNFVVASAAVAQLDKEEEMRVLLERFSSTY